MSEKVLSVVNINGQLYNGNSITINGDRIIIDGKEVSMPEQKTINITMTGNIENLNVDTAHNVDVRGSVGTLSTVSGDVIVQLDVTNGVTTVSGDVSAMDINGDVMTTSGDVECENITGDVSTVSGDIG